ncbi:MAG: alpha/beta hydrolase [Alphaproteobacteria bacterium]|nr:alpha/beta hydrolase [Alphaproteobacteria bacterium]
MTLLTIAGWILGAWLLLLGLLYVGQRGLLYQPDPRPPDAAALHHAGFRPLAVRTTDGLDLAAWHRPAPEGRATVILFQGNAGNLGDRLHLAMPLALRRFGIVLAPYRGYGGAPGKPTEEGLVRDGRAVLEALEAAGVPRDRTVLWGESLGSGIATWLAAEAAAEGRRIRALVLQAPFTSVWQRAGEIYPFVPARWLVLDRFDNLSRIAEIGTPLLIVHGEADAVIPASHGRRLLEAAREPKTGVFVRGADHNDLHGFGLAEAIGAFIEKL